MTKKQKRRPEYRDPSTHEPVIAPGQAVLIGTVTHYFIGRVVGFGPKQSPEYGWDWVDLEEASWIPDMGRWMQCLTDGKPGECEPVPEDGRLQIMASAIVWATSWRHPIPRTLK